MIADWCCSCPENSVAKPVVKVLLPVQESPFTKDNDFRTFGTFVSYICSTSSDLSSRNNCVKYVWYWKDFFANHGNGYTCMSGWSFIIPPVTTGERWPLMNKDMHTTISSHDAFEVEEAQLCRVVDQWTSGSFFFKSVIYYAYSYLLCIQKMHRQIHILYDIIYNISVIKWRKQLD